MDNNTGKKAEAMTNSKTQSTVVAALVIGLLVGFFIGRSWGEKYEVAKDDVNMENASSSAEVSTGENSEKTVKETGTETAKTAPKETISLGNATGMVSASDQSAGNSVSISKVTFDAAGWVVVREDANGGMGNILGAAWFPSGVHENVSVDLLRGTEANKNYFVTLYADNGDKKFDKTIDTSIQAGGKDVVAVFTAK